MENGEVPNGFTVDLFSRSFASLACLLSVALAVAFCAAAFHAGFAPVLTTGYMYVILRVSLTRYEKLKSLSYGESVLSV
jgi:hypothetical protein